ncbi:MAG: PilZ domain-containing protein, partial [Desulfobulbaceae bacterium]|nr:PilZ domain-containing protein [Desulfobulbaceae bacterium]
HASLDDAVIYEANGVDEASNFVRKNTVHLVLYSWDIQDEDGFQFCQGISSGKNGTPIPFLFLISDKKEHIDMAEELVGPVYLVLPCPTEVLVQAIDRVCSPVKLRQAKRYSISDTRAVIIQRQVRLEAAVVNVSAGGALCEFELDAQLNSAFPVSISLQFNDDGQGLVTIDDLRAVATNMLVMTRHEDQTARRLRMGFQFIGIPSSAQETFERIFAQLEE